MKFHVGEKVIFKTEKEIKEEKDIDTLREIKEIGYVHSMAKYGGEIFTISELRDTGNYTRVNFKEEYRMDNYFYGTCFLKKIQNPFLFTRKEREK